MGAAFLGIDIVDKRKDAFRVAVSILKGYLDLDFILFILVNDNRVQHVFVLVDIGDKVFYAAVVMIYGFAFVPLVYQNNGDAFIQKGQLS